MRMQLFLIDIFFYQIKGIYINNYLYFYADLKSKYYEITTRYSYYFLCQNTYR